MQMYIDLNRCKKKHTHITVNYLFTCNSSYVQSVEASNDQSIRLFSPDTTVTLPDTKMNICDLNLFSVVLAMSWGRSQRGHPCTGRSASKSGVFSNGLPAVETAMGLDLQLGRPSAEQRVSPVDNSLTQWQYTYTCADPRWGCHM